MVPSAGQRVGPYEILGRLGSGGMGLVFSAWDSRLQRDVAIKLLREEYARGDSRERFLQEARAASALNHPNICTVFDLGEQDGDPYLVMELLKGETLRGRIQSGPMSTAEVLHIGCEIADALAAAHARGIIHRDIKPANIFLVAKPGGGSQAKVLDFGLAKVDLDDSFESRFQLTGIGSTVGTVSYMSPEQARGETLDARSDLFALGIVLYEMATGRVPFTGATSAVVFAHLLEREPEPARELNPGFSKSVERIMMKLLAKDRSSRYQSASEVLDALKQVALRPSRGGWFSKTSPTSDPAPPSPLVSRASESGLEAHLPGPDADPRKSSSEVTVVRPVRRDSLPPVTLPPAVAHWIQPPLPSLDINVASPSPPGVPASSTGLPSKPPRRQPDFSYAVEEDTAVQEEAGSDSPLQSAPGHRVRWLLLTFFAAVLLVVGIIYWKFGNPMPVRPHH